MKTRVNDFEMYYEDSGSGTAVVFIHGSGGDSSVWASFIPELSKEIRCIAVDLRGHGKSEKPDMPYTLDLFADDVAALLDVLKIDKAYYCGVSMGGFVALKSALNHPEKVRGLILIDTGARIPTQAVEITSKWAKAAEKSPEAYIEAVIEDIFHPMFVKRHKDAVEMFTQPMRNREGTVETYARFQQGLAQKPYDVTEELRNIKAPTLVISGKDDKLVPYKEVVLLDERIPNSQLVLIPFGGHGWILERRDFFMDLLVYFVEDPARCLQG